MKNANQPNTPETPPSNPQATSAGCCGGPAPTESGACCALDAEVKATGGAGCGCGPKTASTTKKGCC